MRTPSPRLRALAATQYNGTGLRRFYACDICGGLHHLSHDEDCRDDESRFGFGDLNDAFGPLGWAEVPAPDSENDEQTP